MQQEMQLIRPDALEPSQPDGHWGVASRFIEQGQRLTVQLCEMAPGGGAEPHIHEAHDQMFFVLGGALRVRGNGGGEDVVVGASEVLRIPAGASHATTNAAKGSTRYLVLTFPAAQARRDPAAGRSAAGTIGT